MTVDQQLDQPGQAAKTGSRRVLPRLSRGIRRALLPALPVAGMVAIWWLLTAAVLQQPRVYPTPPGVAEELVRILSGDGPVGSPYAHARATLWRLLNAFVIAFLGGTVLGVMAGRHKWVFDSLNSLVWIAMAIPSVVWVFIFVVVLGISDVVPVAALVLLLGAPVLLGSAEGTKSVPADLIAMADSYRVGRWQRLTGLYLPSIVPYMVANARVAFALGIKIVIIAEVVGLPNGIGLLVRYWSDRLFMAPVVAWGVLLIALGLIVDRLVFVSLQRRATRWLGGSGAAGVRVE